MQLAGRQALGFGDLAPADNYARPLTALEVLTGQIILVVVVWAVRKLIVAPRLIGEAAGRYRAGRAGQKLDEMPLPLNDGKLTFRVECGDDSIDDSGFATVWSFSRPSSR